MPRIVQAMPGAWPTLRAQAGGESQLFGTARVRIDTPGVIGTRPTM